MQPATGRLAQPGQGGAPALLSRLVPTKMGTDEAKRPPVVVRVRGSKGVKTIASTVFPILSEGNVDGKGMPLLPTPGLPIPDASKTLILSFDNQTEASLQSHYGALPEFRSANIEVMHVKRLLDYNPARPETSELVVRGITELLVDHSRNRVERNVGHLMFDRFDLLLDVLRFYCHHKASVPVGTGLERNQYGPRSNFIATLADIAPNAVLDNGIVSFVGPMLSGDGDVKLRPTPGGDPKRDWAKQTAESHWADKVDHIVSEKVDVFEADHVSGGKVRWAECTMGRYLFPDGKAVHLNGRHLGAFLDPRALRDIPAGNGVPRREEEQE